MRITLAIILFIVTFILMYLDDILEKDGEISRSKKVFVAIGVSITLSITASFLYDHIKGIWFEESIEMGVLRGTVPYFVETDEQYGNFCIILESGGNYQNRDLRYP